MSTFPIKDEKPITIYNAPDNKESAFVLPDDILSLIFTYFSPDQVVRAKQICKKFYQIMDSQRFWDLYAKTLNRMCKDPKNEILADEKFRQAAKKGILQERESLTSHEAKKITTFLVNGKEILCGSQQDQKGQICIFQKQEERWELKQVLNANDPSPVLSLGLSEEWLFCGNKGKVKVWEKKEGWKKSEDLSEGGFCKRVACTATSLIIMKDKSVTIWAKKDNWIKTQELSPEDKQNVEFTCLSLRPGELALGCSNGKVKLFREQNEKWSLETTLAPLKFYDYVTVLDLSDEFVLAGTLQGKVNLWWQVNSVWNKGTLTPFQSEITGLVYKAGMLLVGSKLTTIKIWEVTKKREEKGNSVNTVGCPQIDGLKTGNKNLIFAEGKLFISCEDKISAWY